ncbi:cupredoxin domain-containing protein [Candidatus Saganbacteria bacterium]|nr:cupredoxin domain-containing protein [Candidatus Saganbacteria bacterium]
MRIALTVAVLLVFCSLIVISCQNTSAYNTETTTTTSAAAATTTLQTGATASINIAGSAFSPGSLTITAETTVIWTNNDAAVHTATSTNGPASFDSGNISNGGTYSHKFTTVGTYSYRCNIHTTMTGTVIVE